MNNLKQCENARSTNIKPSFPIFSKKIIIFFIFSITIYFGFKYIQITSSVTNITEISISDHDKLSDAIENEIKTSLDGRELQISEKIQARTNKKVCHKLEKQLSGFLSSVELLASSPILSPDDFEHQLKKQFESHMTGYIPEIEKLVDSESVFDCESNALLNEFNKQLISLFKEESTNIVVDAEMLTKSHLELMHAIVALFSERYLSSLNIKNVESISATTAYWSLLMAVADQHQWRYEHINGYEAFLDKFTALSIRHLNDLPKASIIRLIQTWVTVNVYQALDIFELSVADFSKRESLYTLEHFFQGNNLEAFKLAFHIWQQNIDLEAHKTIEQALVSSIMGYPLQQTNPEFLDALLSEIDISMTSEYFEIAKYMINNVPSHDAEVRWLDNFLHEKPNDIWALYRRLSVEDECCNTELASRLKEVIVETGNYKHYSKEYDSAIIALRNNLWINDTSESELLLLEEAVCFSDNPELRLELASVHIDMGNYTDALNALDSLSPEELENSDYINLKLNALFHSGQKSRAIELSIKAILDAPSDYALQNNLGTFLQTAGDFDTAMRLYDDIIYNDQAGIFSDFYAPKNKALLQLEMGEFKGARETLAQITEHPIKHIDKSRRILEIILSEDPNITKQLTTNFVADYENTPTKHSARYSQEVFRRVADSLDEEIPENILSYIQ